jgi:hypothetical protein
MDHGGKLPPRPAAVSNRPSRDHVDASGYGIQPAQTHNI